MRRKRRGENSYEDEHCGQGEGETNRGPPPIPQPLPCKLVSVHAGPLPTD
jgi:hypothetical protein